MTVHTIKMPDIGEGIAEVELVAWRVQLGDAVVPDQIVADVMTDKATVEIPSPVAGTVVELGGVAGQLMAVGAPLIRIERDGVGDVAASPAPAPAPAPVSAAPPPAVQAASSKASVVVEAPLPPLPDRPLASPAVRYRARERGIDLVRVRGTGPGGRVTDADLDAFDAAARAPAAPDVNASPSEGIVQVPVIGLRRRIAQKMQESARRIPHFTYVEEVDVTELETLRRELNDQYAAARGKLTLLPFLVRALTRVLPDFPQINARFDDDAGVVSRYAAVHLGVATQTDAGLMVPVLRDAQRMDLWTCGREIARLADAARTGSITREALSGSTISLTSLGALGGIASTPLINHPEVAIVGVNRIVERPMFRGGVVVARQLMSLSSSFDHRVVDGMDAARFIRGVREVLERPGVLLVE
jgi:2-oxoisovalerate dehydrogenase E2 component (dihydrolipoyl transacylase)